MFRLKAQKTLIIGVALSCCVSQDLCQRVRAQRVGIDFINNGRTYEGSRMEFRSPEGYSCRFENSDRPSVNFGVGIADPQIIPSSYGYNATYPARVNDPQPVGGVVVRIPFGAKPRNCDKILKLEADKISLQGAQDLFENGLIEEDQLKEISDKVYANLLRTVKD